MNAAGLIFETVFTCENEVAVENKNNKAIVKIVILKNFIFPPPFNV